MYGYVNCTIYNPCPYGNEMYNFSGFSYAQMKETAKVIISLKLIKERRVYVHKYKYIRQDCELGICDANTYIIFVYFLLNCHNTFLILE